MPDPAVNDADASARDWYPDWDEIKNSITLLRDRLERDLDDDSYVSGGPETDVMRLKKKFIQDRMRLFELNEEMIGAVS